MSRGLSAGFASACQQPHMRTFPLIEFGFSSGTSRICGLDFPVTWKGNVYTAAMTGTGSSLVNIGEIQETADSAQGIEVTISGIGTGARGMAMAEEVQGRPLTMRLACIDPAGVMYVDENVWLGLMDSMSLSIGARSDVIRIKAEHIMSTWSRPRTVRLTDARQQALYPGDLGLQYVASMESAEISWPGRAFFLRP